MSASLNRDLDLVHHPPSVIELVPFCTSSLSGPIVLYTIRYWAPTTLDLCADKRRCPAFPDNPLSPYIPES